MRIFFVISVSCILTTVLLLSYFISLNFLFLFIVVAPLTAMGIYDFFQTNDSIRRNYPVLGRMRFLLMSISHEIRQYFIETDTSGTPFNRLQRNLVYNRANSGNQTHPFGTALNVYEENHEWMAHSIFPLPVRHEQYRQKIGGPDCKQPYSASLLNVSAMSYGALSKNAVLALSMGAKKGGFYHNTGEGGVSPYHLKGGADLTWQIGTGYFGCRTNDGNFNDEMFQKTANLANIKMIEIKLSQGAKPGHGGVLPAAKNTPEIAKIRGVEPHTTVLSPPSHKAFDNAEGLLNFVQKLRTLSGGKPIGFKLCVGNTNEFIEICLAMIKTNIKPDFITVDGSEGGTGAAPLEFSNSVGMPLEDGLIFISDTLRGYNLKKDIQIIASGKIISAFDVIKYISLGADLCNSARGMLFSIGCIQALKCDTNKCPAGVTTHNESLIKGLVPEDKYIKTANFHKANMHIFNELIAAAGISELSQLQRSFIHQRLDSTTTKTFEELFPTVAIGSLN